MSDIKLFRPTAGKASELRGDASDLEKPLQTLIEANLEPLLGIRFLATEYSTGKTHGGRISIRCCWPRPFAASWCRRTPTMNRPALCSIHFTPTQQDPGIVRAQ